MGIKHFSDYLEMKCLIDLILGEAFYIFNWAYGKARIRNGKQRQKRKWNRKRNLRNKNWRHFCLESVTNNNCSVKTFHPHIIFIYWYYIFYCCLFCVQCKIFLREFHICVSVASWDHDWHEYSSSLCRLSLTMDETRSPFNIGKSKKIKVFIRFRFTEFEKMLPFSKNISVFVYRSRQSDWNVSTCENVKLLCLEFMLESAAEQHGLILWILVVMFFFYKVM